MTIEQLLPECCPVVKGKQQVTTREVVDFLKGKTIILDCGHKYSFNKGGFGKTMILYADGESNCHD